MSKNLQSGIAIDGKCINFLEESSCCYFLQQQSIIFYDIVYSRVYSRSFVLKVLPNKMVWGASKNNLSFGGLVVLQKLCKVCFVDRQTSGYLHSIFIGKTFLFLFLKADDRFYKPNSFQWNYVNLNLFL